MPMRLPDLKIVITGTKYGYKLDNGVLVIPIGCLKNWAVHIMFQMKRIFYELSISDTLFSAFGSSVQFKDLNCLIS